MVFTGRRGRRVTRKGVKFMKTIWGKRYLIRYDHNSKVCVIVRGKGIHYDQSSKGLIIRGKGRQSVKAKNKVLLT